MHTSTIYTYTRIHICAAGTVINTFIGGRTGASSNLCLRFGIKGLFLLGMGLQYYNMPYYGYGACFRKH